MQAGKNAVVLFYVSQTATGGGGVGTDMMLWVHNSKSSAASLEPSLIL